MEHYSTILIVDDEPNGQKTLEGLLIAQNYNLAFAGSGPEALEKAAELTPDLVLLDVMMPGMDGFEVCRRLRTDPHLAEVPVIMVTALDDRDSLLQGIEAGADDFISKPFDRAELRARVRAITRLNRYRRLLLERSRFEKVVELSPNGIMIVGAGGTIHLANPAMVRMLGAENGETIIGKSLFAFIAPEQSDYCSDYLSGVIFNLSQFNQVAASFIRLDGESFPAEIDFGSFMWDNSRAAQIVVRDITERKQAEVQIREQAALLNETQDAIFVQDLEGPIRFWNRSAEHLYGWAAEEVVGKSANEILFKESSPQIKAARESLTEKGAWQDDIEQITRDGKKIIVESRWTLVRDSLGNPKSILVVNTDITEKKKLEAQFLRAQRMEVIGTLAGGIAHDFNNMLTPILIAAEMLKRKPLDEQSKRIVAMFESSAKHGVDMVRQVLTFAKGAEGRPVEVQLRHLIRDIQNIATETFPKSIEIHTDLAKDLWTVLGDATQMNQILLNLCVNARDAMPNGGMLAIAAENVLLDENYARMRTEAKAGPYVVVSVSDTGTGIPADIIDKIFDPFFTTKEVDKGTGLGLATVLTILKGHGGFVDVCSKVGKGTTFKVYLPALESAETEQAEVERFELPSGHGELILVVDDEASLREITKETLEAYGYRVVMSNDGVEAVSSYVQQKGEIKLVLLDMVMPFMDGSATIRALQKVDPQVNIVAVSGVDSKDKYSETASLGVNTFLSKPYTAETLLKTLYQILSPN